MTETKAASNGFAKKVPTKRISDSSTTLCEILNGTGTAPLSEVLDLLDLAAGRTAFRHVGGMTVTVSFEDLKLESRIPRGAMVRASARVIAVGKSSVLLRVFAEVEDLTTRKFRWCVSAYATFVALAKTPEMRSQLHVPALADCDAEEAARGSKEKKRLSATRAAMSHIGGLDAGSLKVDLSNCGLASGETVRASEAEVAFQKQYLPRHKNFSGMVFGGDLLETMERVATYCGRRFVRGAGTVHCVGIKYFNFIQPIEPMNLWCLRGRVAAVMGSVVYVEVSAAIDKEHNGIDLVPSNEGLFALQLTDDDGKPVECKVSLGLDGADVDAMRAHRKAVLWIEHERMDGEVLVAKET